MDEDVGFVKDTILALLEFLVDPLLPSSKSCLVERISLSQQELVAKQVHAVVFLYNYYHRKQHPDLEFIGFNSFCKMAVAVKPSMLPFLNLMQKEDCIEEDELDIKLSLTEKAIINCCHICECLDASNDNPVIEGWPISKVAVFLVDSKKENCYLLHSSITQGVWSVIEKDVDDSTHISEAVTEMKNKNKKKRVPRTAPKKNQTANEASYQQIAFLAVKEVCGISQSDLITLESHVVFSIGKSKTAVRLYIMQCTQTNGNVDLVPINDVIKSMQGPLVVNEFDCWITTSVIEYFHLLPFADKISDWLSREGLLNTSLHFKVANEDTYSKTSHKVEPLLNTSQCSEVIKEIEDKKPLSNTSQCSEVISSIEDKKPLPNTYHHFETVEEVGKGSQLIPEPVPNTSQCIEAVEEVENDSSFNLEVKPLPNTSSQFETVEEIEIIDLENCTNSHIKVEALPIASDHREEIKVVDNYNSSDFDEEKLLDTSQPSAVVTEVRNENYNHSKEELLQYSSQHSEAAKEVKYNSNSHRKADCTKTLVYKRNRFRKNRNFENSSLKISNATMESLRQQDEVCAVTGSSTTMDIDESLVTCSPVDARSNTFPCKNRTDNLKQMTSAKEKDQTALIGGATVVVEVIDYLPNSDDHSVEKVPSDYKISDNTMSDQAETSFDSNVEHLRKAHLTKKTLLSQISREKEILSQQLHRVADDLALCESKIQTILSGGEESYAVIIDTVLKGCNDKHPSNVTTDEDINRHVLDQELGVKRRKLSEANLFVSACQELDSICNENGWKFPTYYVSPSEGGFKASVTITGIDFDCSGGGAICDNPYKARNSAALNVLVKLRSMAAKL